MGSQHYFSTFALTHTGRKAFEEIVVQEKASVGLHRPPLIGPPHRSSKRLCLLGGPMSPLEGPRFAAKMGGNRRSSAAPMKRFGGTGLAVVPRPGEGSAGPQWSRGGPRGVRQRAGTVEGPGCRGALLADDVWEVTSSQEGSTGMLLDAG